MMSRDVSCYTVSLMKRLHMRDTHIRNDVKLLNNQALFINNINYLNLNRRPLLLAL